MTTDDFRSWYARMGYGRAEEAAVALGLSAQTVKLYLRGTRYDREGPITIPDRTARLCRALEAAKKEEAR